MDILLTVESNLMVRIMSCELGFLDLLSACDPWLWSPSYDMLRDCDDDLISLFVLPHLGYLILTAFPI